MSLIGLRGIEKGFKTKGKLLTGYPSTCLQLSVRAFTNKCCLWRESEKRRKPKACEITKSSLLRMGERPTQKRWLHVNIPQLVIQSVASNKLLSLSLSLSLVCCITFVKTWRSKKLDGNQPWQLLQVRLSNLITVFFILLVHVSNSLNLISFSGFYPSVSP